MRDPRDRLRRNPEQASLGFLFPLLPIWVWYEFARPRYPLKIPMLISLVLFVGWLRCDRKLWNPQILCFLALLILMILNIPLAENWFSAYFVTRSVIPPILFVCVPLAHFVDSFRRLDLLVASLLLSAGYVAIFAITHGGFGPGGAAAGQDENYVSNIMAFMTPLAIFSIYAREGWIQKALLAGLACLFVATVVVSFSRGGFLGLVGVFTYCWLRSPRKILGTVVAALLAALVIVFAGGSYWKEMDTITQTDEGTADMRIELWKIATREYLAHPVFGVGPGNYPWNIAFHQTPDQYLKFGRALAASAVTHSLYFELIAELGTVGALTFLALCAFNYRDLRLVERRASSMRESIERGTLSIEEPGRHRLIQELLTAENMGKALVASGIGFLICSIFLSTLYTSSFWMLSAMTVALRETTMRRLIEVTETESAGAALPRIAGERKARSVRSFGVGPLADPGSLKS